MARANAMHSATARYGAALLAIAVATGLRFALEDALGGGGFMIFFVAVIVASYYGGLGPSLTALTLSIVISARYFGPPADAPPEPLARSLAGLSVFFFTGIVTAVISQSMREARRRAEELAAEAIRQQDELRATLSCIGDAVLATDPLGRLTMMNPVAEALTGWSMAETVGRPLGEIFCASDEQTGAPFDDPIRRACDERMGGAFSRHMVLTSRDGTRKPIDEIAAPIRDAGGEMSGMVLIFRDVSERLRTEAALRDADRRKDEFLAILSHELRNPLAPISVALELLRQPQSDTATLAWAREVMERQVRHLVRLVDDLLDLSRITRGKIELRPETVDLCTIIRRAADAAQPLMKEREHQLDVVLPPAPVVLSVDPFRLAQVIDNLLNNAAKYTPPGGRIAVSAERRDERAEVRVRDNGIGISAEMLPRVFELFAQAAPPGKQSQGGLGIGLNLVKELVELSGGSVEARSAGLGQGSEFIVRLPIVAAADEPAPPADDSPLEKTALRRRIFVVDDNADAAEALARLLAGDGHDVLTFQDGASALRAADVNPPEIALLDLGMPEMDGFQVARRLRGAESTASVLLVAVTGWGQESDRQRTRAAGFDHHLVKPVDAASLRALISQASRLPA